MAIFAVMDGDLACNTGKEWFVRIDGVYYVREIGKNWVVIDESALPADVTFYEMHPLQRKTYGRQVKGEG